MVTIITIAVAAALVWVFFTTLWLWHNQERVVFQPPSVDAISALPADRVEFVARDGHRLFGFWVWPAGGEGLGRSSDVVLIAFHGNADLAAWLIPWAREAANRTGAAVFLPEYRGYAGIPGTPTYESAGADALGALTFAKSVLPSARIALFGHSLGTALAADVAAAMHTEAPAALILQSPFTSAREMATRLLVPPIPWLWRRISRVHYDTRTIVATLDCPVFVSHGGRDAVVPLRMGRQVFAAARRPGELLIVPEAGHNDVPDLGGERYWQWLRAAVRPASVPVGELEEERHGNLP